MGDLASTGCSRGTAALGGLAAVSFFGAIAAAGPFATVVLDYTPAPGQFVNNPAFNDPSNALGAPSGGGTGSPNNASVVTLGAFGGSITLGFDEPIADDPLNPYGLDLIVFGNALWTGGDPSRRFAEAGIVEVSCDTNGNGLPDDEWYVIRGSSLPATPLDAAFTQDWDDDPNTDTPPSNASWYPDSAMFPEIPSSYATSGFLLPAPFQSVPLVNPGGPGSVAEAYFGYADLSPTLLLGDLNADNIIDEPDATPEAFYTRPDNPFLVGVSVGSGGGDAIDIAWAVHPTTGLPARLPSIDFVRISTGPNSLVGILGEMSTEVDAVASVAPRPLFYDLDGDDALDLEDLYAWHDTPTDLTGEGMANDLDRERIQRAVRAFETQDSMGGTR
ncbi:hypothetical protein ABWH91_05285 [Phycisphaerales bacterium ac7]